MYFVKAWQYIATSGNWSVGGLAGFDAIRARLHWPETFSSQTAGGVFSGHDAGEVFGIAAPPRESIDFRVPWQVVGAGQQPTTLAGLSLAHRLKPGEEFVRSRSNAGKRSRFTAGLAT
jgi:hypothetical protein